jgi:hypothetical protein
MKRWTACELHAHTLHSDGDYSVRELLDRAAHLGLEAMAVTDHDTEAAHDEIGSMDPASHIPVVRGVEWTTFYGHALVIGCSEQVDWRSAEPETIDEAFRKVRAAGGITGVAHPFAVGDPICCGCRWQFNLRDWHLADMLEIWSGASPQNRLHTRNALELWNMLLDQGFAVTGISARDWHGEEDDDRRPFAVTYLWIDPEGDITEEAKRAVRERKAYLTVGPGISATAVSAAGNPEGSPGSGIGGSLPAGAVRFQVTVERGHRAAVWEPFALEPEAVVLIGSGGRELSRVPFAGYGKTVSVEVPRPPQWVRVEVHGTMLGDQAVLAVANPVYFRNEGS